MNTTLPYPLIQLFDAENRLAWETGHPLRIEILARFGAEDSLAKVQLDPRMVPPVPDSQLGRRIRIRLEETICFDGKISGIQHDPGFVPVTLQAARRPRRLFQGVVRGLYLDQSPTQILEEVLSQVTGPVPVYTVNPASTRIIDRLDFQGLPLFYAIDLLARLAGNWLWWIDWEANLHFVPALSLPEQVWYYDPEQMLLKPGLRDRSIKNQFRLLGGVSTGAEFERYFGEDESTDRYGQVEETLFARPITTETAYQYLREAVLEQAPAPTRFRYLERSDGHLATRFGERFQLRGNLPEGILTGQVFRVAAEEILWTEEQCRVRYHLAEDLESATRYTRYLDHDPHEGFYAQARLGPFTLDLSALDSEPHLDS
jgi:hypothetical protein